MASSAAPSPASNFVGSATEWKGWKGSGRGWFSLMDLLGVQGAQFREISIGEALQQAAVTVCLDVMAQDTGKAPIRLRKRTRSPAGHIGSQVMLPEEHPVAALLWLRPNKWMTWPELVEMTVFHLGLVNNAYWIPRKTLGGDVLSLVPILPGRCRKDAWPDQREFCYRVSVAGVVDRVLMDADRDFILFEDEICHFATRRLNGVTGASTLFLAQRTLALNAALQEFQNRLFTRGDMPRGVFELPEGRELTQEQFDRVVDSFKAALRAVREEDAPIVVEGGAKWQRMAMTAMEAGVNESWDRAVSETARMFRIPPYKLQHYANVKYENMDSMAQFYADESLIPRARVIEERLTFALLTEREIMQGLYIEFDREALYITDIKSRTERATKLFEKGIITKNRALEMVGENPAEFGDVYMMPANTFLISTSNEVIVTNQAAKGDGSQPKDETDGDPAAPAADT
ncbi:hypothetical protein MTDSW087_05698 [Methylobacterium dankookense]|uniref:Phage portal protein n=2 Tax=Methylobacterium dankookense TaxID=560405 RepID=A0A564G5Y9_9HYPH|nr:hypothetical protein IFDJLNFL_5539 [Methylobacterium dankookense]VUF15949.1 hypothetical protein MTDSW087_05698 [Methylobacterium dankookense]